MEFLPVFVLQKLFGGKTIMVVSPNIGCFSQGSLHVHDVCDTQHDRLSELTCRSNTMKKKMTTWIYTAT